MLCARILYFRDDCEINETCFLTNILLIRSNLLRHEPSWLAINKQKHAEDIQIHVASESSKMHGYRSDRLNGALKTGLAALITRAVA